MLRVYHNGWFFSFSVRQMIVTKIKYYYLLTKTQKQTLQYLHPWKMYMNTQELLSPVWFTNCVKGVRMKKKIAQKPKKSSLRLEPLQSLKCTLSTYWHKSLPTVTPKIQQMIKGWFVALSPKRLEMRHEALRRKRDTDIV